MKRLISFLRNKLFTQSPRPETEEAAANLWIFSFLPVLLTLAFSFHLQKWYWGLMDDACILSASTTLWGRVTIWFTGLYKFGELRPLSALHAGSLYTIFESRPEWLYVFRVFEIAFILLIWGYSAYRITGKCIALFLVAAITLSFHYFYDAFFYLSSSELIGLLFLGIALNLFLLSLEQMLGKDFGDFREFKKSSIITWLAALFFLFCTFGSKETYISSGFALGLGYLYLAWRFRKNSSSVLFLAYGLILICISLFLGIFLSKVVRSNFTATYLFTPERLIPNFRSWIRKDLFNHLPWIIGAALLYFLAKINSKSSRKTFSHKTVFGILLGIFFYFGYLFLLLPWSTTCQYATPLGLFFAFLFTLLLVTILSYLRFKLQFVAVIFAMIMNQFVCQYALTRESTYQYDTANVMVWLRQNRSLFEGKSNIIIASNASEPSDVIPALTNRKFRISIRRFNYVRNIEQALSDPNCKYFLFSPRFAYVDIAKIANWEVVFYSKNWVIYRKLKT